VLQVPSSLRGLLSLLAACFTEPTFETFTLLVLGAVARVRDRTVTGMLQAAGVAGVWHHSRAHDLCRPPPLGRRRGLAAARLLAFLATVLVKRGMSVRLAIDDAGALSGFGAQEGVPARPRRPELRRPRLAEPQRFVVRVGLRHAKPPMWRRLEVRSDLKLDVVHRVLQAAFDWMDSHLWRFLLGGDPFSPTSQVILCPWDVEEGDFQDEGGVPAGEVRLDEAVQAPDEVLSYAYDYGDGWELALRLEHVLPATVDIPSAVRGGRSPRCTAGGMRRSPDRGGARGSARGGHDAGRFRRDLSNPAAGSRTTESRWT
jgi:hypothetical protein